MEDYNMPYWIIFKKGQYVSGTDENGYPLHTENKDDTWKFYDFDVAMSYFNLGYCIRKEYK